VDRGGGFVVNNGEELYRALHNLLHNDLARTAAGEKASRFVQSNVGATERFLQHLEPYLEQGPCPVKAALGEKGE
jgi:3-deoxy-D-manno-octulosonic-acid transferase